MGLGVLEEKKDIGGKANDIWIKYRVSLIAMHPPQCLPVTNVPQ